MKCKNCEKGMLAKCPECGCDVVICLESDVTILSGYSWDKDYGCNGIGGG